MMMIDPISSWFEIAEVPVISYVDPETKERCWRIQGVSPASSALGANMKAALIAYADSLISNFSASYTVL
eukprot:5428047-Ditylum_brightwellii.AAC.1